MLTEGNSFTNALKLWMCGSGQSEEDAEDEEEEEEVEEDEDVELVDEEEPLLLEPVSLQLCSDGSRRPGWICCISMRLWRSEW